MVIYGDAQLTDIGENPTNFAARKEEFSDSAY